MTYMTNFTFITKVGVLCRASAFIHLAVVIRNEFNFWNVHGIMNTSGLVQSKCSGFTLTLKETRSIRDSMNIPEIGFITYIYILYYQSSINFQLSPYLAGFPDILN